jgi:transposase
MAYVNVVGLDETNRLKGHNYISIFIDMNFGRLLFATEGKDADTIEKFTDDLKLHNGCPEKIHDIAIDMSPAFISRVERFLPNAHITFDKFHIMKNMNSVLDQVRRTEVKIEPILKGARFCLLKNSKNLTESDKIRIKELYSLNLATARAYRFKESLSDILNSSADSYEANFYLIKQISWGRRSRIPELKDFALSLKNHLPGILRYFVSRLTSGMVEGMNSKIQEIKRRARGFPNVNNFINMLYLCLSGLEIPKLFATGLPKVIQSVSV